MTEEPLEPEDLRGPHGKDKGDAQNRRTRQREQPTPQPTVGPSFAQPEANVPDLSAEIVRTVARKTGEQVTCRRISGNHYRCNWWAAQSDQDRGAASCLIVTTHRVCRSEFLYVTKTDAGLVIEKPRIGDGMGSVASTTRSKLQSGWI